MKKTKASKTKATIVFDAATIVPAKTIALLPKKLPRVWRRAADDVVGALASRMFRQSFNLAKAVGGPVVVPYEDIVRDVYRAIPSAREGYKTISDETHEPGCLCRQESIVVSALSEATKDTNMCEAEFDRRVEASLDMLEIYMMERN